MAVPPSGSGTPLPGSEVFGQHMSATTDAHDFGSKRFNDYAAWEPFVIGNYTVCGGCVLTSSVRSCEWVSTCVLDACRWVTALSVLGLRVHPGQLVEPLLPV
jgi:hypothetical protein